MFHFITHSREDARDAGPAHDRLRCRGPETWTLTSIDASLARQLAMSSEDDAFDLLTALLDGAET